MARRTSPLLRRSRKLRSSLYRWAKLLGDINAVLSGQIGRRVAQRIAGKLSRRGLNKLLK